MNHNTRNKKRLIIAFFFILILGLGYAVLQTTLNVTGMTKLRKNTWGVYWDNLQVMSGSVSGDDVELGPDFTDNDTCVSFSVHLSEPGDYYEFTLDAVNNGSLDAMIQTISKTVNNSTTIPSYLVFSVTYADGIPIVDKQIIKANNTETYRIRVEYKKDIIKNDLPQDYVSLDFTFDIDYIQADSTAQEVRRFVYTANTSQVTATFPLPANITFDDPILASQNFGHDVFLRHTIVNNEIYATAIGLVKGDNIYYFTNREDFYYLNYNLFNRTFSEYNTACEFSDDPEEPGLMCFSFDGEIPEDDEEFDNLIAALEMGEIPPALIVANSDMYGCAVCNNGFACGNMFDESSYAFCGFDD